MRFGWINWINVAAVLYGLAIVPAVLFFRIVEEEITDL